MKGGLRPAVASDDLGVPQRTGLDSLETEVGVAAPGGAGVTAVVKSSGQGAQWFSHL